MTTMKSDKGHSYSHVGGRKGGLRGHREDLPLGRWAVDHIDHSRWTRLSDQGDGRVWLPVASSCGNITIWTDTSDKASLFHCFRFGNARITEVSDFCVCVEISVQQMDHLWADLLFF